MSQTATMATTRTSTISQADIKNCLNLTISTFHYTIIRTCLAMEFNSRKIKLVIGLGNPDSRYENTYHNVGFLFVDGLRKSNELPKSQILKSDAYMNLSGSFVARELKKRGLKPDELLVVHDDSDINLDKYKFSFGRGAAGHHGIESVIKALGTKNFWRLRLGIRQEARLRQGFGGQARARAAEFVLKNIIGK